MYICFYFWISVVKFKRQINFILLIFFAVDTKKSLRAREKSSVWSLLRQRIFSILAKISWQCSALYCTLLVTKHEKVCYICQC